MDTEKGEALMERAFLRVDEARREKAGRMKSFIVDLRKGC